MFDQFHSNFFHIFLTFFFLISSSNSHLFEPLAVLLLISLAPAAADECILKPSKANKIRTALIFAPRSLILLLAKYIECSYTPPLSTIIICPSISLPSLSRQSGPSPPRLLRPPKPPALAHAQLQSKAAQLTPDAHIFLSPARIRLENKTGLLLPLSWLMVESMMIKVMWCAALISAHTLGID